MISLVECVPRTGHVLRIFQVLLLWPHHGKQQIAGAGFPHRNRREAPFDVNVIERLDLPGFKANVQETDWFGRLPLRIELNELTIIDLEERLRRRCSLGPSECLLIAELRVEVAGLVEIGHAEGRMSNAGQIRFGRRRLLGV